jgi:hypothetical protein
VLLVELTGEANVRPSYARQVTYPEPEEEGIRAYVEREVGEEVVHVERASSELVGPVRHDVWDVHCADSRWWVLTNPTNLYSQADFKSRDVAVTFHVGLTLRMMYLNERRVPVAPRPAALLPGSWRRWQQAFETYEAGDEAETFQAVGVRLRECLVSFIGEASADEMVPEGETPPKAADFKGWTELLANHLAPGESASRFRSFLRKTAEATWELVNRLTHDKSAVRLDAEIALKAVEHLLGVFTAARLRFDREVWRCDQCGSYDVRGGRCVHCGWVDASYQPPDIPTISDEEMAEWLAEPCTPSSDISTFIRPGEAR